MVQYKYDAWGNHSVQDANGADINDAAHVGSANPFRYRGYYYDTETGLYYLKTRYYDPETGRFITIDDTSYLDPETINGLNLYAYCGDNPVMNIDPNGTFFWLAFLAVIGISALIGGVSGGVTAAMNGQNFWLGFAAGAIGGAVGGAISMIPGLGMFGNLLGRVVSSGIFNVANELFQTGTLENMDWGIFTFDLVADTVLSMLYVQWAQDFGVKIASAIGGKMLKILKEAMPSLITGLVDAFVDIFQTGTWFNKRLQEKVKKGTFSISV